MSIGLGLWFTRWWAGGGAINVLPAAAISITPTSVYNGATLVAGDSVN